jgi:hypothetical protein
MAGGRRQDQVAALAGLRQVAACSKPAPIGRVGRREGADASLDRYGAAPTDSRDN